MFMMMNQPANNFLFLFITNFFAPFITFHLSCQRHTNQLSRTKWRHFSHSIFRESLFPQSMVRRGGKSFMSSLIPAWMSENTKWWRNVTRKDWEGLKVYKNCEIMVALKFFWDLIGKILRLFSNWKLSRSWNNLGYFQLILNTGQVELVNY